MSLCYIKFMIKAVIFDMDGTLIDTEPYWRQVEIEVANSVGIPLTTEMAYATIGMTMQSITDFWAKSFPDVKFNRNEVIDRIYAKVIDFVRKGGEPMPGVMDTIDICLSAGLKIAIASSSRPVLIKTVIDKLGLNDKISIYCSATDEKHGKPAPDVYLTTSSKLGVKPSECLAFEDSPAGVESAKSAGMKCIVIPEPSMFDNPRFGIADLKLRSMTEFNKETLRPL